MKHTLTVDRPGTFSVLGGRIGPAKCLCYRGWDAQWTVTKDGAECSHCGEQRRLGVPAVDVLLLACSSCGTGETTWFASAKGDRVCSCCGERR